MAVALPSLLVLQSLLTVAPAARAATVTVTAGGTVTIPAGSQGTASLSVDVPARPPKADILIAIDTTGSMEAAIAEAKAHAQGIVTALQDPSTGVPDSRFAVVDFRDSGDGAGEYIVRQAMTADKMQVDAAIGAMSHGGGGDLPEAHNLVFHNSYVPATGGAIGWRTGSKKIVVVISDAQPHGAGKTSEGLAGCTDTTADPHEYSTKAELEGMAAADRTLFMVRANNGSAALSCYQSIAQKTTGGQAVDLGTSLGSQIVSLVNASFNANVADLHMEVATAPSGATASWFAFDPTSRTNVGTPSTQTFTATITVPGGATPGTYDFDLVALADGTDIGHQTVRVIVPGPSTRYVNPSPTSSGGGSCAAAEYASIAAAVASAIAGDTIHVCAGTYTLTASITVPVDLTFVGDGAATTIIDGNHAVRLFDAVNRTIALRDLTLRNGSTSGQGGAIHSGAITVEDSRLIGNDAGGGGGAIWGMSHVTVRRSVFDGNTAGIGSPTACGGAIVGQAAEIDVAGSTFVGNRAGGCGGAIYGDPSSTIRVTDTTFDGNRADAENGGAIRSWGPSIASNRNLYVGNQAGNAGGAIANSVVTSTNDTFTANSAGAHGGAVAIQGSLTNVTFSGNSASTGSSILSIGTLQITNTIVANPTTAGANCAGSGRTTMGGNFSTDASCGFGIGFDSRTLASLALGALAENGGPTRTIALSIGSVALNQAVQAACPATDQRGAVRPQGLACDSGAYESDATFVPVNAPVLVGAYHVSAGTHYAGYVTAAPSTTYEVSLGSATTCPDGALPAASPTFGTPISVSTDANGQAFFRGQLAGAAPAGAYVAAKVTGPGGFRSDYSPCVVDGPDNDTWPRALSVGPTSTTQGYLDLPGRERWFKFSVQPGSRVQVDLKNLPADYDLVLFRDIKKAYDELMTPASTADLTRLGAEYAASGFTASGFTASGFTASGFTASGFTASGFTDSVYSASGFTASGFTASGFTASGFTASGFTDDAFSASGFTASGFTASGFTASGFTADPFSGAQTRSLVAISASTGLGDEVVAANTWLNTGEYYVRVSGKNGASSLAQPFTLQVSSSGNVCAGVTTSGAPTLPATAGTYKSIILLDSARLPGYTAALRTQIDAFASRPEVKGVVVDLKDDARVAALNTQADGKPACVYAKNLVAESIRDLVLRYRAANSTMAYVMLLGGDDVIPFFRSPDQASLAPESGYVPPVKSDSASEASLRNNYVLSQDAYGAGTQISLYSSTFPIPELAVGRLVETGSEISGMLTAYTNANGVVTPNSSLVTGYDFLDDAATLAQQLLIAGTGATDGSAAGDKLITPFNQPPSAGWTADQLRTKLLGTRHDIVFLAGHFSANSALAADYATSMTTAELVGSTLDQTNVLLLSIGCHSGYNVPDAAAVTGVTDPLDWAQALARKRMTSVLGTGYQYGDTEFLEYSERIYTEIARRLRYGTGPVSIGQALVAAKLDYLIETPDIRDLHEKALREATLYGLPMLRYDLPQGRGLSDPSNGTIGATSGFSTVPGSALGLQSADVTVSPALTKRTKTLVDLGGGTILTTWYQGGAGVVSNPGEPAIPLESIGVGKSGYVLRGVRLVEGTYTDESVVPLSGAPATELKTAHTPFTSPTFFPSKLWSPNYIDALTPGGDGTRLLVTPAQHKATSPGDANVTLRKYTGLKLKLYYSNSTSPGAGSDAPSISDVSTSVSGTNVTFRARVVGDPRAGVQEVWVTYTGLPGVSKWQSTQLVQDPADSTLWTATVPLSASDPTRIDFLVQAVNGFGLVGVNDRGGAYHQTFIGTSTARSATTLALAGSPTSGAYGSTASVSATVSPAAGGKLVTFSIGGVARSATTTESGVATAQVPLTSPPGVQQLSASFAGDASTLPSGDARPFTITKASTNLTLSQTSSSVLLGADSGVVATLTEGSGATPLAYRTIYFVLGGPASRTTTAITDFAGKARLGTLPSAVGIYTVTACFNGPSSPSVCSTLSVPDPTYGASGVAGSIQQVWPFAGFFAPVNNLPYRNVAKAGSTIPVKFSLSGDRGLGILDGTPSTTGIACNPNDPVDGVEQTSTANSGLLYDSLTDTYLYNWKTVKTYAGKCYRLDIKLKDGTVRMANFEFK